MYCSLLIEEPLFALRGEHSVVPDIWMDIQSARSIEPKANKVSRFSVIAR
jgi:hypothetical protein